ncbi:MAG: glycoside hydrolase family 88 protein, partial [Undibacterium sp.]|nr:glycoside hydrolase family 88 protein [Opitutaceae bacterium]
MNRRAFLHDTAAATLAAGATLGFSGRLSAATPPTPAGARHFPARVTAASSPPLPAGKRSPFGWQTALVGETPLLLAWPDLPPSVTPTRLRFTVGLDVRDEKLIEVFLPQSGRVVGTFDLRYGCIFQPFEIPLAAADLPDLRREGLGLRRTKGADLRIFTTGGSMPAALQPHLLVPGATDVMTEYFARMDTLACVQSFSWQGGCVLDGLLDPSAVPAHAALRDAARRQLAQFIIDGKLVYENHVSDASDGRIYGIEGTLPFAALAHLEPASPLLENPLKFSSSRHDAEHTVIDGGHTSSEGAYTVGYPLAVIGRARRDEALQQLALTQLRTRHARLFDGRTFWRTRDAADGKLGDRNWARGIAWQLLGAARTFRALDHRSDLAADIASFRALAAWAQTYQRPDGLWSCFVDEPTTPPDTAGSAGIAAALAIGARQGWLGADARTAAEKSLAGLRLHLTPDGFLG